MNDPGTHPQNIKVTGSSMEAIFISVAAHAQDLGFKYCVCGVRLPIPITRPRTMFMSNYPPEWQSRYNEQKYLEIDPTVAHGMRTSEPAVWSDDFFASAPQLWAEAKSYGLRQGWALSRRDSEGAFTMLVLARSDPHITPAELATKEWRMRQLAETSHMAMKECLTGSEILPSNPKLSDREIDVLRWTADGKTASEIADIMGISERTVNFHVNQVVVKLEANNKVSAAVRAAMLGLLW